jgi:hypothetical protein
VLGLLPSSLSSSALIKVGALLCVSTHIPTVLNTQSHQKTTVAAGATRDLHALFIKAKKLRAAEGQPVARDQNYLPSRG